MSESKAPAIETVQRAEDDLWLSNATPEQVAAARKRIEISQAALADWDKKNAVKSEQDFERKISRMDNQSFAKWKLENLKQE